MMKGSDFVEKEKTIQELMAISLDNAGAIQALVKQLAEKGVVDIEQFLREKDEYKKTFAKKFDRING